MNFLQGRFLVAAPYQLDPNFAKSAVLVVEHTDRRTLGLVVTGPSKESDIRHCNSRQCFPETIRLFFGGPWTGPLMAVHTKESLAEWQILPGVFFSETEKNVVRLMRHPKQPFKIFFGYASWEPGRLDHEVDQGVWRVVPAKPAQIFSNDSNLWEQLARLASGLHLQTMFNFRHIPLNPLLN